MLRLMDKGKQGRVLQRGSETQGAFRPVTAGVPRLPFLPRCEVKGPLPPLPQHLCVSTLKCFNEWE